MDDDKIRFLENKIREITKRYALRDPEDFAQEMWIAAIELDRQWNPSRGVPWPAFMAKFLWPRAVDTIRRISDFTVASRRRRRVAEIFFSTIEAFGSYGNLDLLDRFSTDAIDAIDWADLGQRVAIESREVQMLYLYMSGLLMREIGERFGVSETRVVQILRRSRQVATHRLWQLTFGRQFCKREFNGRGKAKRTDGTGG